MSSKSIARSNWNVKLAVRRDDTARVIPTKAILRLALRTVLLIWLFTTPTEAAEIECHVTGPMRVTISFAGEIVEGEGEAFKVTLSRAEAAGYSVSETSLIRSAGACSKVSTSRGLSAKRRSRSSLHQAISAHRFVFSPSQWCHQNCSFWSPGGSSRRIG